MSPESACSLGPLLAHKRNIILMAIRWWDIGGPLYMFIGSQYPVGLDVQFLGWAVFNLIIIVQGVNFLMK